MELKTPSTRFAMTTLAAVGLFVLIAAGASAQGPDLGELSWPAEDHRSRVELADLGERFFASGTDLTTIGERPIQSIQIDRIDETTTRIEIAEDGGASHLIEQDHKPNAAEGHTTFKVSPSDLRPTVHVRPEETVRERDILRLMGPPGTLELEGTTTRDKVDAFADELGFPVDRVSTDASDVSSFPQLYQGRTCLERSDGECQATAAFRIDCPSCQLASFLGTEGDSELDRRGSGQILFNDQGKAIAATVSYALDLNESALLDLEEAVDRADQDLRQRGHEVKKRPAPETVTVRVDLDRNRLEIQQVRYLWSFTVAYENRTINDEAIVDQNAATGELLSVELIPLAEEEPRPDRDETPGFVLGGLAAALTVALAVGRSRRRG